jgi:hypothetical protein
MKSRPAGALLLRGAHLAPYSAMLNTQDKFERWLDSRGFARAKKKGKWKEDIGSPRVVQTGIVNMEASRRLVATEVPAGVYLGNSVNYWVPRENRKVSKTALRGYLLGLLNSTPLEWRFRLTSSNNNINLYEVRTLPLPQLETQISLQARRTFLKNTGEVAAKTQSSAREVYQQVTQDKHSPPRNDLTVALLIGQTARLRAKAKKSEWAENLDVLLDYLVNWHLGLKESDLDFMWSTLPGRSP